MEVVKKPTRKLRKAPVEEKQKEWYEHELWTEGTYKFKLDPVIQSGNVWFWENLTPSKDQPINGKFPFGHSFASSGVFIRATKDGSIPRQVKRYGLRPI